MGLFASDTWVRNRIAWLVVLASALFAVAIWRFADQTGMSLGDLETLSKKRFVSLEDADEFQDLAALGPLRMLAFSATAAYILVLGWALTEPTVRGAGKAWIWFVVACLFVMSVSFPFLTSNRSGVIVVVVATLVTVGALKRQLPFVKVLFAAVFLIALAVAMGQLRQLDGSEWGGGRTPRFK